MIFLNKFTQYYVVIIFTHYLIFTSFDVDEISEEFKTYDKTFPQSNLCGERQRVEKVLKKSE